MLILITNWKFKKAKLMLKLTHFFKTKTDQSLHRCSRIEGIQKNKITIKILLIIRNFKRKSRKIFRLIKVQINFQVTIKVKAKQVLFHLIKNLLWGKLRIHNLKITQNNHQTKTGNLNKKLGRLLRQVLSKM